MPFITNTDEDRQAMLARLGLSSVDDLFSELPVRFRNPDIELPPAASELEIMAELGRLARGNASDQNTICFIGGGVYDHFIPSLVDHLASRGEFTTAYTPYQAEASQGTLQAIYEYQTMVADLTGTDVVNASHYDGATSLAEACMMALAAGKGEKTALLVAGSVHPEYRAVIRTYLQAQSGSLQILTTDGVQEEGSGDGAQTVEADAVSPDDLIAQIDGNTAAVVVQNPDFFGRLHDIRPLVATAHDAGALVIVHTDPIALGMFRSPGADGADIVTGEGQPLGIPLSSGGPYLGIFGCRGELVRRMPGRLVGEAHDHDGNRGFVLTLNTREQHIRRERATSNICTNQGLMALRAAIYLAAVGPGGLQEIAELCYHKAHYAAAHIDALPGYSTGISGGAGQFFKEFVVTTPQPAAEIVAKLGQMGISAGLDLSRFYPAETHKLLLAVTERRSRADIDTLITCLKELAS